MNKVLLLEKYIKVAVKKALKEQEEQQRKAEKAMYLVYRFPGLKKLMEELMSPAFGRYVNGINIVAPKPTTFKVDLTNGQDFSIKYVGKGNFQPCTSWCTEHWASLPSTSWIKRSNAN